MRKEELKLDRIIVTRYMASKVKPIIQAGDIILVNFTQVPALNQYVLISYYEKQWIVKYKPSLKLKFENIYPIVRVIMNH